ncbi:MAG TPA: hypothetical protein VFZ87_04230, partial [Gemmatimonadales bacterium]
RACTACRADLSPQAGFCHRCGTAVGKSEGQSDRRAWAIAGALCVLLVGGIAYKVSSSAPQPAAADMANAGNQTGRAPDISAMSPRERFDRLFNRIMQAAERGESDQVAQFTPMALGAYQQLDSIDVDSRYHAAVIHLQAGNLTQAKALADTILAEVPGHLFGYVIRGTAARIEGNTESEQRAQREFLAHFPAESAARRVEYLEHRPVLDEFRKESGKTGN